MDVSVIVAVAENGVIGRSGGLPWRLRNDLRWFKRLTTGHHLLMGRKTFESIGVPLPGRVSLVLTSRPLSEQSGLESVESVQEALDRARARGESELFVIGGAAVYEAALPCADRLYLTEVHACVEGDTRLPSFDRSQWREQWREFHGADADNEYDHTLLILER